MGTSREVVTFLTANRVQSEHGLFVEWIAEAMNEYNGTA